MREVTMTPWVTSNAPKEKAVANDPIPDTYADQFQMALSAYGIALTFAVSPTNPPAVGPATGEPRVIVRMSLEHAKVMAMMIRKNLRQFEREHLGEKISVPKSVYAPLGLEEEAHWDR